MSHPRLSLILDEADALPPTGRILVLNARAGFDAAPLPRDRALLVQGFRPDHDALHRAGFKVAPTLPEGTEGFAAAVIFLPGSRSAARALVAAAVASVRSGAPIWIDGQKTDGIDPIYKDIRARVTVSAPFAKAHGKIFRMEAPEPTLFADWLAGELVPAEGFVTVPGVFSAEKVDPGSALLAAALPADLAGTVVDLGAGWGWLAAQVLGHPKVYTLYLVEADHDALSCARRNIADARAVFEWADATDWHPERAVDWVVMNPPFHAGRAADPALGAAFIRSAARMLKPSGRLMMVANRHLPYEAVLGEHFREVAEIGGDGAFKVFRADRPVTRPAPRPRR
ncbi:MAG: class I SAM-dependent methyltransferase [Rhodobacteraceae bacterium]|nr:class I SAM-dependent methyltransferase [Paracoccaceae bacterium]